MIIKKINIEFTDDPNDIRNEGLGDYWDNPDGSRTIKVFCKNNSRMAINHAYACLFHEMYEHRKCEIDGVSEKDIDIFDAWHLKKGFEGEPGDHPSSIYRKQHRDAEFIERYIIDKFGEWWFDYEENYAIPEDFKYNENYGKDKS
jgi:hypothetical protein